MDEAGQNLVKATERCLQEAIALCRPGRYFRDIGAFIQQRAHQLGFKVVPAFIGHGIGSYFHGPPDIFHISKFKNYTSLACIMLPFEIPVVCKSVSCLSS